MEKHYLIKWDLEEYEVMEWFQGVLLLKEKEYQDFSKKLEKAKSIILNNYPDEDDCEGDDLYTTDCGDHTLLVTNESFNDRNLVIKEISPLTYDEITGILNPSLGYINIEDVLDEIITMEKYLNKEKK